MIMIIDIYISLFELATMALKNVLYYWMEQHILDTNACKQLSWAAIFIINSGVEKNSI